MSDAQEPISPQDNGSILSVDGPWGQKPRSGGGGRSGGNGGGRTPPGGGKGPGGGGFGGGNGGGPDFDDFIRKGQDSLRQLFPQESGNKKGIALLLLVALVLWLASGLYVVDTDEEAVVMRFGEFYEVTKPGLRYHLPSPIDNVVKLKVTNVQSEEIGFRSLPGRSGEDSRRQVLAESLMLTGDENIVDIHFVVQWRISDARKLLFNLRTPYIDVSGTPGRITGPEETVRHAAESAMREVIGKNRIAEANSQDRAAIEQSTRQLVQEILDSYDAGIKVEKINVLKVEPPEEVVPAFKDVQSARADKERAINEAEAYRNDMIPRARGKAEKFVQEAKAYESQTVNRAQGEADRFVSIYEEYRQAQDVTKKRLYIETMESILRNKEKVLIDPDVKGVMPFLPLPEMQKRAISTSKGEQQ